MIFASFMSALFCGALAAQSLPPNKNAGTPTDWRELAVFTGHMDTVASISFSSDTHLLVSRSVAGTTRVWDLYDGSLRASGASRPEDIFSSWGPTRYLANRQFRIYATQDHRVQVNDAANDRRLWVLDAHLGPENLISSSPDGVTLATVGDDEAVRLWNLTTGEPGATLDGPVGGMKLLAFSPDGRILASAGEDRVLRLLDPKTGKAIASLSGHTGDISSLSFSPEGDMVATGSADKTIRVYRRIGDDPRSPRKAWEPRQADSVFGLGAVQLKAHCELSWAGHLNHYYRVQYNPVARRVAGKTKEAVRGLQYKPNCLALARDAITQMGALVPGWRQNAPSSNPVELAVWDAVTGKRMLSVPALPDASGMRSVAFSPEGDFIAYDDSARMEVPLVNVAAGTETASVPIVRSPGLQAYDTRGVVLAVSSHGRRLAVGGVDRKIRVWDTATRSVIGSLADNASKTTALAFSSDAQRLAFGDEEADVRILNIMDGSAGKSFTASDLPPISLSFSPDGLWVAGLDGQKGYLWDARSGALSAFFQAWGANSLAFDALSKDIYVTFNDRISLFQVPSGSGGTVYQGKWGDDGLGNQMFSGHLGGVASISFSPDGERLTYGTDDGWNFLWALSQHRLLSVSKEHDAAVSAIDPSTVSQRYPATSPVTAVAFSGTAPDILAYGEKNGALHLVRMSARENRLLAPPHTGPIIALAFSNDGKSLASVGDGREASIWDVAKGRLKARIRPRDSDIKTVAFSRSDRDLAYGGTGGSVRFTRLTRPLPGISPNPDITFFDESAPTDDVDTPPLTKAALDPEAYAVVIGVEKYRLKSIPEVTYAARDAQTMQSYLTQTMGFDPKNVVLLRNDAASKADLEKYLGPWLRNNVTARSRVLVYFAGHGAPNPEKGTRYIVPHDGDPSYLDDTGYPVRRLYENLARLPAKDVRVVFDACFLGQGARSLLAAGARPLVMKLEGDEGIGANTVVIAASSGKNISTYYPDGQHGLLTQFLLKGLQGKADEDGNGRVTTEELFRYAKPRVEREARRQNVSQIPVIIPVLEALGERGGRVWARSGR